MKIHHFSKANRIDYNDCTCALTKSIPGARQFNHKKRQEKLIALADRVRTARRTPADLRKRELRVRPMLACEIDFGPGGRAHPGGGSMDH